MRSFLTIICIISSVFSFSQETNLGIGIGSQKRLNSLSVHAYSEFRPVNAVFSINLDPSYHNSETSSFITIPFYFKFIIGDKFRVCPSLGAFFRTNSNSGWMANLNLELPFSERMILTAQCSRMTDYWETDRVSPGGMPYTSRDSGSWTWFNLGIKRTL